MLNGQRFILISINSTCSGNQWRLKPEFVTESRVAKCDVAQNFNSIAYALKTMIKSSKGLRPKTIPTKTLLLS